MHPTAVVSGEAGLGEGVSVGPYAVVEAGALVGSGTRILAHAVVTGHATIGRDCEVHYGAVVGHDPQDLGFEGGATRCEIGDGTVIREHATVHRSTSTGQPTRIGRRCLLMGHSHVAHDCQIGDGVVICNSALVAGHAQVGERAFLSGNTVVHQFCRLGKLVMLSGISGVARDVGPYLTVASRSRIVGLNMVGMRRAGYGGEARKRVKEAYRMLFGAASLEEGTARVATLGEEHEEITAILEFFAASRRGFSRPTSRTWWEADGEL